MNTRGDELLAHWRQKTGNPYLTLGVARDLERIEKKFRHLGVTTMSQHTRNSPLNTHAPPGTSAN